MRMFGSEPSGHQARVWSLAPPYRNARGAMWAARLPRELHGETDTSQAPHRSPLRLFEDGRQLGPAHTPHHTIEAAGRGRYSFWMNTLFFSPSDGSDPNENGRSYTVAFRRPQAEPAPLLLDGEVRDPAPEWRPPARTLRCAFLGLGNRGLSLARQAKRYAGVEIAWLADRSEARLNHAVARIETAAPRITTDFMAPLEDPSVDVVLVALPDHLHRAAAEPAFRAGKDVYLEKPIATNVDDGRAILRAWQHSGRVLQIGYVLRHAPFYRAIREAVRSGLLGRVRLIALSEQLDVAHGASFMRRWHAQSANSGGLMVHKGCHDLDLVCWLLDARPRHVSSFGGSDVFARPAPARFCSECEIRAECPYVDTGAHESRAPEEWANPSAFGLDRCVFRDDKDIVDNQLVAFELDNDARGSYHLAMQGPRTERRITLFGDDGRLDGVFEDGRFTVAFADGEREPLVWSAEGADAGSHGGGDKRTMLELLNACTGRWPPSIGEPEQVIAGLVFACAAEQARRKGIMISLGQEDFSI